ncbi:MAG: hypothetical protein FWC53_00520 [Firmicutes bacterium]|nr:hypothetical protein [Bacillota bacterium]
MKLKIFKIILLCLIIITLVVGVLVAIQYIGILNSNKKVNDAMTSITEQFENIDITDKNSGAEINVEYGGYKVVRNNRNT